MTYKRYIGVATHPWGHALEWNIPIGGGKKIETYFKSISPALRQIDYKCPHCLMIEYE